MLHLAPVTLHMYVCGCVNVWEEDRNKTQRQRQTARQTNTIGIHKIKHRAEKQSHSQEDLPCRFGSICSLH